METDTENERLLSLQLYGYLGDVLGTEDVVRTRRKYFAAVDMALESYTEAKISSGSKAEGLDLKGSDLDIMTLRKDVKVCEKATALNQRNPNTFIMQTNECKPGFAQLKLLSHIDNYQIYQWCVHEGTDIFLSNKLVNDWFANIHGFATKIHGPCVADMEGNLDHALCFRCPSWAKPAQNWIKRKRNWPSQEIISSVTEFGVLFVPVGCKGSPIEEIEWRLSFSVAEKQLIFSFTQTQLFCYGLLKILLKEVIEPQVQTNLLLCSYFLKTIVFWVSEELTKTSWEPINLLVCFRNCFNRLLYCVEYKVLPHYFIDGYNLFEDRFSESVWVCLRRLMVNLGWIDFRSYFMYSSTMRRFCSRRYFTLRQNVAASSATIRKEMNAFRSVRSHNILNNVYHLLFAMPLLQTLFHYKRKSTLSMVISVCYQSCKFFCQTCPQCVGYYNDIQIKRQKHTFVECHNKNQYQIHKQIFPYILLSVKNDVISGWLYLASYFYKRKQYIRCLTIIDNTLLRAIRSSNNSMGSGNHFEKIDLEAFRYRVYSIPDIYRRHEAENLYFYRDSLLVPNELEIELFYKREVIKPPIPYAHFLRFLCLYYLNNFEECNEALNTLAWTLDDVICVGNSKPHAESYNCLGIAQLLLGDETAAIQSFNKSLSNDIDQAKFVQCMLDQLKNV